MRLSWLWTRPRWQYLLAVIFLAQLLTAIGFSTVFPFLPLYIEELGSTTGMSVEVGAGLVISLQALTMAIAAPIWGAIADRYGRKLMSMRAQFGGAILLVLMGLVTSTEQLILLRAIQGLVTGTVAANNALVASAVPRNRVGLAMGTLQVGLWAGIAIGPLMGGALADSFGFSVPFMITAVMLFVGGLLIYFGVQEDFEPEKAKHDKESTGIVSMFVSQWRHVLAAEGVVFVLMLRFLVGVARNMILPIAPLFVVALLPPDASGENSAAGLVIAASSATATFSGVYLGRLGDRVGHRLILIACSAASVLFYIPQVFVSDVTQLLLLQGLSGFAAGGLIAAPAALLANYTDQGEEGAVFGIDNAIVAGARSVAPLVGSAIALGFGLRGTFGATAFVFVLVMAAAMLLLPDDAKQKRNVPV
ncbi:MFS transporter [Phototrophicus methaneseepsis]|uniref:MFS transporter n=1 Tax=Phototrophicus methaneseepsis TaxID=2710758 RepID=A0A7S8EDC3_9CHLR|nr:MFS transporter [Phototrophicus methaneseepsis]QPC84851.1 MFS transporter [Phototrophicus methaneseepsis]